MVLGTYRLKKVKHTHGEVDVLYMITNTIYLRVCIGRSGYITSAFPVHNDYVEWTIMTYQARIPEDQIAKLAAQKAPLLKYHSIQLTNGRDNIGLLSIYMHHREEFNTLSNTIDTQRAISKFIRETMERNDPVKFTGNENGGINVIYPTRSDNYLKAVIGERGSVLTAYPLSNQDIEWEIKTDKVGLKEEEMNSKLDQTAPLRTTHIIYLKQGNNKRGLRHIVSHLSESKLLTGRDSTNDIIISKFIKDAMEAQYDHFVKVIQGNNGGINVLYRTEDFYLLVKIQSDGNIHDVYLKVRQGEKKLTWSLSTTEVGITANDIDACTTHKDPLRYNNIVFLEIGDDTAGLTKIHKQFQSQLLWEILSPLRVSQSIKHTMERKMDVKVECTFPAGIKAVYKMLDLQYLEVRIWNNGYIRSAQLDMDTSVARPMYA